jgi:hypothetical protein
MAKMLGRNFINLKFAFVQNTSLKLVIIWKVGICLSFCDQFQPSVECPNSSNKKFHCQFRKYQAVA